MESFAKMSDDDVNDPEMHAYNYGYRDPSEPQQKNTEIEIL